MIYTLSDLQAGRVAVVNDGTLEQLNAVLQAAWPGCVKAWALSHYYFKHPNPIDNYQWTDRMASDIMPLPRQSVSLFSLREEPQERVEISWESVFDNAQSMHMVEFINNMRELYNISKK